MPEPILITAEIALNTLNECVQERGAYHVYKAVYESNGAKRCLYVDPDGKPGCLAGLALHKLGVPLAELQLRNSSGIAFVMEELGSAGITNSTQHARMILQSAQVQQDYGVPWGEAVAWAGRSGEDYVKDDLYEGITNE